MDTRGGRDHRAERRRARPQVVRDRPPTARQASCTVSEARPGRPQHPLCDQRTGSTARCGHRTHAPSCTLSALCSARLARTQQQRRTDHAIRNRWSRLQSILGLNGVAGGSSVTVACGAKACVPSASASASLLLLAGESASAGAKGQSCQLAGLLRAVINQGASPSPGRSSASTLATVPTATSIAAIVLGSSGSLKGDQTMMFTNTSSS